MASRLGWYRVGGMATPRTREPALGGGDATAPGRAIEVLEQARALLGPGAVPELLGDEADLEAGIDNALTQVRDYALAYEGPDALEVVRVAYELTHIAWEQHKRVMDRRVAGLSSVQRALAE